MVTWSSTSSSKMAFDWRRYLALADELAGDPREEMQRSSISRAYYCVYHLGLEYA